MRISLLALKKDDYDEENGDGDSTQFKLCIQPRHILNF